ncbi:MAG: LTA synthase family protein [Gammaproteobacteria bacterium]
MMVNGIGSSADSFSDKRAYWYFTLVLLLSTYFAQTYYTSTGMGVIDGLSSALLSISLIIGASLLGTRAATVVATFIILINIALVIGSKFYLELYQSFVPYSVLTLAPESLSLVNSFHFLYILAGVLIPIVLIFIMWNILSRLKHPSKRVLLLSFVIMFSSSLSLQAYHDTRSYKHFTPYSEVPMGYFIRTAGLFPFIDGNPLSQRMSNIAALAAAINEGVSSELPDKYINAVNMLYPGNQSKNDFYPLISKYKSRNSDNIASENKGQEDQKNIIVIVLESFRASEMGLYGNDSSSTPFLDSLSNQVIWAKKFYSTAPLTVKSETAINCGVLDYFGGTPVSVRGIELNASCIPNLLRENGYETFWFHGNIKSYYNRVEYLPNIGFENNYAIEDLYGEEFNQDYVVNLRSGSKSKPVLGWGIPDGVLYKMALDRLENTKEPFYAEILSVSNHLPFDWDWGIKFPLHLLKQDTFYDKYRRGMYYSDNALRDFFEKFRKSDLFENTIIIITGDHGVWTFDENQQLTDLNKHEQFFRVPFMMYGKNISPRVVENPASHVDIPPTILSILGIEADAAFLGRSLIDAPDKIVPIYTLLEASYGVRLGNKICIPSKRCFRNGSGCENWEQEMMKKTNIDCYTDAGEPMFDKGLNPVLLPEGMRTRLDNVLDYLMLGLQIGFIPEKKTIN